jgi:hypothetical protein
VIPKIQPPPTAAHFQLWMLTPNPGRSKETGRRYRTQKPKRLYGEASEDGRVVEVWPISAFDPRTFVRRWGPGRYRVQWIDGSGDNCGSKTFLLTDPSPAKSVEATRSLRARGEDAEGDRVAVGGVYGGGGMGALSLGPLELMQLLDQRAEREHARAASESEARMQRDREFFAAMQMQQQQLLAVVLKGGAGRSSDAAAFDPNLIRRELAVTMREGMQQLRADLSGQLAQLDLGGGGDEDEVPPKDLSEATERMGIELVQELTKEAPELLQKAIPAFWKFLTKQGYEPSAKMRARVARTEQQRLAAARVARAVEGLQTPEEEEPEEEEADEPPQ